FITKEFDLSTKQTEWVATIVVAGSIVGALAASRLANAIGRKPTMVLVAVTYAVFVDYALAGPGAWRVMLALSAVPSLAVLVILARLPDTPRWYLMKGRRDEARSTLERTDPDADIERELDEIEDDLRRERGGSIGEMLRAPYRRATLFVLGLGFLIQITGINAVVFYSPLIFKEMGFSGNTALLLLPALVQVGSLVATVVSLTIV